MAIFTRQGYQRLLQGWICLIGVTSLGNTLSCFVTPSFISEKLYTGAGAQASELAARLFGMWTLIAALLRIICAFCIFNRPLYHLTFLSFLIALFHFTSEAFYYKTAPITIGVVFPFIACTVSMFLMIVGYFVVDEMALLSSSVGPGGRAGDKWRATYSNEDNLPRRVEDIRLPPMSGAKHKNKKRD